MKNYKAFFLSLPSGSVKIDQISNEEEILELETFFNIKKTKHYSRERLKQIVVVVSLDKINYRFLVSFLTKFSCCSAGCVSSI